MAHSVPLLLLLLICLKTLGCGTIYHLRPLLPLVAPSLLAYCYRKSWLKMARLLLNFRAMAPSARVMVDASPRGTVRGFVEYPDVELPLNSLGNFDVGTAIGSTGYLHVTIDSGFGQPHTSTIELSSGEVGEDINHFLVNTDQTGSLVVVGTHLSKDGVEAAGGLIIQLLSDHTEETICRIENNISTFGTFTFLMKRGMTLEQILQRILTGFEITPLTDVKPLSFACKCSRERFVEA
jgi:molecular chaperone Hsp33